jgi:hypothetical protein
MNTFSFTDMYHEIKLRTSEIIIQLYVVPTDQNSVNICIGSWVVPLLVNQFA